MTAALLNFFFPPQCPLCEGLVGDQGSLCGDCWGKIRFISPPFCAVCGLAFDFSAGDGALCGDCLMELPPYTKARAVFAYDEHSRGLVTQLKYGDQGHLARSFGGGLATSGREVVEMSDVIVPVPLHYWRFLLLRPGLHPHPAALRARVDRRAIRGPVHRHSREACLRQSRATGDRHWADD